MASRPQAENTGAGGYQHIIDWYRVELAKPAEVPWVDAPLEPVCVGPTWRIADGHWVLPDASLGWDALGWCGQYLQHGRDDPWAFTLEQARFILWWYAVDETGRFFYRDGMFQRLKGHGKDPIGFCLCMIEAFGPARVADMVNDRPVPVDVGDAWVQTAAVSLEQTKNTMRLAPQMCSPEAKSTYKLQIGKEIIHGLADTRTIQAVTSSPSTLEGARATFVLRNETHHWLANNDGHEMAAVIERNATKSADGAARALSITNAYDPAEDSVAQHHREAWENARDGAAVDTGLLLDSLEANEKATLDLEGLPDHIASVRGDSTWLDIERIVQSVADVQNPPSRSRRFWLNQIVATEDAWIDPLAFDACAAPSVALHDYDEIALFFDGSKSDDATGLVGCRLSDGHVVTLGMWQRPPGGRGDDWLSPRGEIDRVVREVHDKFRVVAFFADPSHALEDETEERFWDSLIDDWHRRWCNDYRVWADGSRHSVMWDMTSPKRTAEFTAAAEQCQTDIERSLLEPGGAPLLTHDGDSRLRRHAHNAKRFPNKFGVSLWKGHRSSQRKVDLAVCMVGARMARRVVLNKKPEPVRSGVVW